MLQLWHVAVNSPLRTLFTYSDESGSLQPGTPVRVPFGPSNRKVSGLIVDPSKESSSKFEIKAISEAHPERPQLSPVILQWLQWLSDYYIHPLGQIQEMVFPPLKKAIPRASKRAPVVPTLDKTLPPILTEEQQNVIDQVSIDHFQSYLLHGVTGSGKTEVYIHLIEQVLNRGQSAMVLVPEIALTPQLIHRFAERFTDNISVIHSHLTDREKTTQWWKAFDGEKKLLIGARSALFCPIPNLGLIIVDEEHETSFKQEEKLKYNARDAAIKRAQLEDCPIVLGSATPSLESWNNALTNKFKLLSMKNRVSKRKLPHVDVHFLGGEKNTSLPFWLSKDLFDKIEKNLKEKHQSALFLNRRGMAPSVQCFSCGFISMCPNCDITLTLHGKSHLVCHYCDYHESLTENCPECKEGTPQAYGLGTEAVERDLQKLFPEARIFRADRDEVHSREALEDMISGMEKGEIDILVGTQMIAKGLDFPNLTLVGLVLADVAFNIPDFRASERSFQLCTQVSGRAGRDVHPGEVIIQTYKTKHPSILFAKHHDFIGFAEQELENRKLFSYPPFGKIASFRLSGLKAAEVEQLGHDLVHFGQQALAHFKDLPEVKIMGPTPAPLARIKNRYRYHVLLKSSSHQALNFLARKMVEFSDKQNFKVKCQVDIDPYSLL